MSRSRHPNSEIENTLKYVESCNWKVEQARGSAHAWGQMYCPRNDKTCRNGIYCITSIWSTPRNPGNHAKKLKRVVDGCAPLGNDDD